MRLTRSTGGPATWRGPPIPQMDKETTMNRDEIADWLTTFECEVEPPAEVIEVLEELSYRLR